MNKADIVLKSSTIFTSEDLNVISGAVAIKGEKIMAVITDESQLKDYVDEQTQVIDYGDKLIIPGFIDPHFHFNLTAIANSPYALILNETNSEEDCIQMITEQRNKLPNADRIYGFGWLNTAWENPAFPTKESLDKVCPDIPVYLLSRDGHNWWFNSKAIEESGITPETKLLYGEWKVDENGELTGIGIDNDVTTKFSGYALKLEISKLKKVCYDFMQDLNKTGITSIAEPAECPGISGSHQYFEAYDELNRELDGGVPVRMFLVPSLGTDGDFTLVKSLREKYQSAKVRVTGLKQFIDGVTMIHTAYTLEPYTDDPSIECKPLVPRDILQPVINAANREGFSVRLHAISDGSARMGLDMFEESQKQCDMTGIVNTLEHLDNLDPADIPRFGQLGVIASMQPSHMSLTESYYLKTLGEKRAKYAYMHKELLNNGATLAFGTDNPCAPYNPFETLYYAVTRCDFKGNSLTHNPEQAVTLGEAIRAYTYGSACAVLASDMIGTLTPGKYADLVVVDGPMFGEDPKELLNRKPILTMSAGKVVYKSESNEEREKKAAELAYNYAKTAGVCSQATVAGIMNAIDDSIISKDVFKAATGLGGGIGKAGSVCGALTGGTLCLSVYAGRDYESFEKCEGNQLSFELARELVNRFENEYGCLTCLGVQKCIMGKSYLLSDPKQAEEYKKAGGNTEKCPAVCGKAASWVIEILQKQGLI